MSHVEFDPYRVWLQQTKRPEDFYELLQLPRFESNLARIERAAQRAILLVRAAKPGERTDTWKSLLDQLDTARDNLTDPQRKAIYDRGLRQAADVPAPLTTAGLDDPAGSVSVPRPPALIEPLMDPMAPIDPPQAVWPNGSRTRSSPATAGRKLRRRPRRVHSRRRRWPWLLGGIVAAAIAAGLLAHLAQRLAQDRDLTARPTTHDATSSPAPIGPPPVAPARSRSLPTGGDAARVQENNDELPEPTPADAPVGTAAPASPTPGSPNRPERSPDSAIATTLQPAAPVPIRPTEPPLSRDERAELGRALTEAQLAISHRDFDRSRQLLERAENLARTPELADLVARLASLDHYVREFWDAVEESLRTVEGTELEIGDNRAFVVEVKPDVLVLRAKGRNRGYPRGELPPHLALAIADRWLNRYAPSTSVIRGAFMAVTPSQFSPDQVRQLWSQAAAAGADVGDLMQVLDDSYDLR